MILGLTLFVTLPAVLAVAGNTEENLSPEAKELCSYDNWCHNAIDLTGNIMQPNAAVLKMIERVRDNIIDAGQLYGVDPRAIAGSIAAENTMNLQKTDDIKRALASTGISHIGSKSFSIGLGQIHTDAAMEVESMMAKVENRPERTVDEVAKELLIPSSAVKYAAAILRQAQDIYKSNGIDISKNPELLSTLYNLGKVQDKADALTATKRAPKPNYFGVFVSKNMAQISETIGWDPVKGRTKPRRNDTSDPNETTYLKNSIMITSSPSTCNTDGKAEVAKYNALESQRSFPERALDSRSALYRVVGQSVDCQMKSWKMIETGTGQVGWVKEEALDRVTGIRETKSSFTCNSTDDVDGCKKKALGLSNQTSFLGADAEKDFHFLPLPTAQKPSDKFEERDPRGSAEKKKPVDWRAFNSNCLDNDNNPFGNPMSGGRSSNQSEFKKLSKDERLAYADKLDQLKEKMAAALGIDKWDSSKNPLGLTFGGALLNADSGTYPGRRNRSRNGYPGSSGGGFPGSLPDDDSASPVRAAPVASFYDPMKISTELRNCGNSCTFDMKQLDSLVAANPDDLKSLKGFATIKNLISNQKVKIETPSRVNLKMSIDAINMDADDRREMAERDARAHIADSVKETCQPIFDQMPKVREAYDDLVAAVEKSGPNRKTRSVRDIEVQTQALQMTCKNLIDIKKVREGGAQATKLDRPCSFQSKSGEVSTLLSVAAQLNIPDDDKLEFLLTPIKEAKGKIRPNGYGVWGGDDMDHVDCRYDPIASAKLVNDLASLPCVEAVLAADPVLTQNPNPSVQSKVFNLPIGEGDRFAVKFKQNCTGSMNSPFVR